MGIIIPISVILSGSIALAIWLKKRIEETFGMYAMLVTAVLYFCYLFDVLIYGLYFTVVLSVCMLGGIIFKFYFVWKRKKSGLSEYFMNICSPGLIVFFIVIAMGWMIVRNNIVIWSDPMRLWGAYPKALYYTDALQLGKNSLIFDMEQSYIPGMPLLVYFFEKLACRNFSEPLIYLVYVFAAAVCFLPALSKLQWSSWGKIPFLAVIILALPLTIYNNFEYTFFFSLFIDPLLGMFMAYLLFLLTRPIMDEWFLTIQFILGLIMCILLKDSAIAFAAIVAIWVVIKNIGKGFRHFWMKSVFILATPVLTYYSWQMILAVHGLSKHSVPFSLHGLLDIEFMKKFIVTSFSFPMFESLLLILPRMNSFAGMYILISVISMLIWRILAKERRHAFIEGMAACILMQIIYMGGYYVLCLNGWGHRTACYGRYLGAILLGQVAFVCMFLMWKEKNEKIFGIMPEWTKAGITVSMLCTIVTMSFKSPNSFKLYEIYEDMDKIAEDISNELYCAGDKVIKLFMICDGYDWYGDVHHRVYFDLLGSGVQVGNYVTDCVLTDHMTQEEFREELIMENFDYVYLLKGGDKFISQFGTIFCGSETDEATLWMVNPENGKLKLAKKFEQRLRY